MPKTTIIPVITIDGPGGSGKGTISQLLAKELGFHFLDSGALYRLVALAAELHKVDLSNEDALRVLAEHLDVRFVAAKNLTDPPSILLEGEDVTDAIRTAAMGVQASIVGGCPGVRTALLNRQRAFLTPPGLVADGRDMGTVVFPQARLKIFLTASADERAQRRYNQLINKGESVNLPDLLVEIQERDERDSTRSVSPLRPADDAVIIDTTSRDIAQVFQAVLDEVRKRNIVTA